MSTERATNWLITVHTLFLALASNQNYLSNMAVNGVGRKFEDDLQKALKESLALFPVDESKAEQRLLNIFEKTVPRRNVFRRLSRGYTVHV